MSKKRIFIVGGHGGKDSGAIVGDIVEKDLNTKAVNKVFKRLKEHKIDVIGIRLEDKYITRKEKCNICNRNMLSKDDLAVFYHHNQYPGACGVETYRSIFNDNKTKVYKFCDMYLNEMRKLGFKIRGIGNKTRESEKYPGKDYYDVIKFTKMKAVIIEAFFINCEKDVKLGKEKENEIIESIVKSICWYIEVKYIPVTQDKPQDVKHWAEECYWFLKDYGVSISDKLYDTPLYRGNAFSMMADIIKIQDTQIKDLNTRLKTLEDSIKDTKIDA
jgi:N-acetylmuramoyl-L-alanine amidase